MQRRHSTAIVPATFAILATWTATIHGQCSPSLLGSVQFNGGQNTSIMDVAVGDGVACVSSTFGVEAISVVDPSLPVALGNINLSYPRALEIRGDVLYVGTRFGVSAYDLRDPSNMTHLGSSNGGGETAAIDVEGSVVYSLNYPALSAVWPFNVWSFQNVSAPTLLGEFFSLGGGIPRDLVSGGNGYVYVTTSWVSTSPNSGLKVVDVDPPSAAGVVATLPGSFGVIGRVGSHLIAASNNRELTVIDVTTPLAPQIVRTLTTRGIIFKVVVEGSLVYAGGEAFDFRNPAEPVSLGQSVDARAASGGHLYTAGGAGRPFNFSVYDAGCDTDGDGLLDSWEVDGIPYVDTHGQQQRYVLDVDDDGQSDADPLIKDLFVEIDTMSNTVEFSAQAEALVVQAFTQSPVDAARGVRLHIQRGETIPGITLWSLQTEACMPSDWEAIREAAFGSPAERTDAGLIAAKQMAYRYCVIANRSRGLESAGCGTVAMRNDRTAGCANGVPSQSFVLFLGTRVIRNGQDVALFDDGIDDDRQQAALFMHELGHALGLLHGGNEEVQGKPNYPSVMNYVFTMPDGWNNAFWRLDYSHPKAGDFQTLSESSLIESHGIGGTRSGQYSDWWAPFGFDDTSAPGGRGVAFGRMNGLPIDFGSFVVGSTTSPKDSVIVNFGVPQDLNYLVSRTHPGVPGRVRLPACPSPGEVMHPFSDWDNLHYAVPTDGTGDGGALIAALEPDPQTLVWLGEFLPTPPSICPADFSGASDPSDPSYGIPDSVVDLSDFFYFLDQFVLANLDIADLTGSTDPVDPDYGVPDGVLDASDFFYYLDLFVAGCP